MKVILRDNLLRDTIADVLLYDGLSLKEATERATKHNEIVGKFGWYKAVIVLDDYPIVRKSNENNL